MRNQKLTDNVLPACVRTERISRPYVKAGMAVERLLGDPAPGSDHTRLVGLDDNAAVTLALKVRGRGQVPAGGRLIPFQVFPTQCLKVPALRARDMIAALVAFEEGLLDPALIFQRGRRR